MAININRLLKKKGWSGIEVGKALVASVIHDIRHGQEKDFKPLFSQSDFARMESSISTQGDFIAYSVYRELYESILTLHNKAQSFFQQVHHGYYRYLNTANNCILAEREARLAPLVMTREEYQLAERKAGACKEQKLISPQALLFLFLEAYLEDPDTAPDSIREHLQRLEDEPAGKEAVLAVYNEVTSNGYYSLPDGTRSDMMTGEEWSALQDRLYCEQRSLEIDGQPASVSETRQHFNAKSMYKKCRLFYMGVDSIREYYTEATGKSLESVPDAVILAAWERMTIDEHIEPASKQIMELQASFEDMLDDMPPVTTWHYYTETPELNKLELLEDCIGYYSGYKDDFIDPKGGLREFKKDYPGLYAALDAYMKESVPALRELKAQQYHKASVSWKELAELGILDFRERILPTDADIAEAYAGKRHVLRDIAIWKNDAPRLPRKQLLADFTLEAIAASDYRQYELTACQDNLIKPALRFIYAFNAMLGIIATVFDLPEATEASVDTARLEHQIDGLNNLIFFRYATAEGTPEEKARTRELWRDIYAPLQVEDLKPDPAICEEVQRELAAHGISKNAVVAANVIRIDAMINRIADRGRA